MECARVTPQVAEVLHRTAAGPASALLVPGEHYTRHRLDSTRPVRTPSTCDPFGIPIDLWKTIAIEHLSWQQTMQLANSCAFLIPLRHSLDLRQEHLLAPGRVASGMLTYRQQERSKFIPRLITRDRKKNNRALQSEVDAGLDIFRQWWQYEPYEDRPPGMQHKQTETTRHSDLGYAVLRGRDSGLRRYWRLRVIVRDSDLTTADRNLSSYRRRRACSPH